MIDAELNLDPKSLAAACKGNTKLLPSFIVHDDDAWPWYNKIRPAKGKLHIRRSTFLRVVTPQVPVKPGLWLRADAQEFFIDLQPHHLQGGADQQVEGSNAGVARIVAKADSAGRLPDEADYNARDVERSESRKVERRDLEEVASRDEKGSVRSAVLSGSDDG